MRGGRSKCAILIKNLPRGEFLSYNFGKMTRALWKIISEATDSDSILLGVKEMLHTIFDAEYVIVYIAPELVSRKLERKIDLRVEFVAREEVEVPPPVSRVVYEEEHRFIDAQKITEEVIKEFIRLGAMQVEGYDAIIENFFIENTYIGFISMHRKDPFSPAEKRKFSNMKYHLKLALRAANYLSILEDFEVYLFEQLLNRAARKYRLSPGEQYVLKSIFKGLDLKEIAVDRGTSIHAIKKSLRSVYKKMGVKRRAELLTKVLKG